MYDDFSDRDFIERELIALLFSKNELLDNLQIKPKYLSNATNEKILEAMIRCYKEHKILNTVLMCEYEKHFPIDEYIDIITNDMFYSKAWEKQFKLSQELILKHFKEDVINNITLKLNNKEITYDEFQNKMDKIKEINITSTNSNRMKSVSDIDLTYKAREYIKSGCKLLDSKTKGFALGELSVWSGSNACVDCETEYFNGFEWKKISEYTNGEKVLQYNQDGTASLVTPIRYIKEPCDKLYSFTNMTKSINQCISDEHRIIYITSKGNLYEKRFCELKDNFKIKNKFSGKIIPYFSYQGNGIKIDENVIRLMVAVSADGSKAKKQWRIRVYNQEKIERLRVLIKKCDLEIDERIYTDKSHNFYIPENYGIKVFPNEWYNMNKVQFEIIQDEIYRWDGRIDEDGGLNYSTTIKSNADFIQFVLTSLGKRTSLRTVDRIGEKIKDNYVHKSVVYLVHQCKNKSLISMNNIKIEEYNTKDNFKYCFEVPSSMLVLRKDGSINITGNSAKSTYLNQIALMSINQGYKVGIFSGELTASRLMGWLLLSASGKKGLSHNEEKDYYYVNDFYKQRILNWLDGKLFIYDNSYGNDAKEIIESVKICIEKNGVKVIILDNLMSMNLAKYGDQKFDMQTRLITELSNLAKDYQVHIHFVCHPRKSTAFLRKIDISGSADLTNIADNVLIMHRVNDDFRRLSKETFKWNDTSEIYQFDNVIEVCKNREFGVQDLFCGLFFEIQTKRLLNTKEEVIKYGWEYLD